MIMSILLWGLFWDPAFWRPPCFIFEIAKPSKEHTAIVLHHSQQGTIQALGCMPGQGKSSKRLLPCREVVSRE